MELAGIDIPKTSRERVAEIIGTLVKTCGSQAKLVHALVQANGELAGLTREAVSAWVNGRALPREPAIRALADLAGGDIANALTTHWAAAQHEKPLESAQVEHHLAPPGLSVLGIVWLGMITDDLEAACRFYHDVLRLHFVHRCERDHAIYRTDGGDYVALYGPKSDRVDLFTTGPVAGFRVGNIVAARAEMEAAGVTFLGPILSTDNGRWKYLHFLGPDSHVFELVEEDPWADDRQELTSM